jgi:hypothetical protein
VFERFERREQVSHKPEDAGYVAGIKVERERIIKLLEDALEERRKESISLMGWKYGKNWTPSMNSGVLGGMTLCLALIKGENK